MSDISNRIDQLLFDNKLRRADLVRATGIKEGTVRAWTKSAPSAEAAIKVAKYFNVSVEWLITGEDSSDNKLNQDFSSEELELISIYRRLDPRDKDFLILNARSLISRYQNEDMAIAPDAACSH